MICDKCGQEVAEDQKDPWCMYQMKDGKVISQLFHPDQIPEGWHDSPKAAQAAVTKRGPGRPPGNKPKDKAA
jgi:hypothetical protein